MITLARGGQGDVYLGGMFLVVVVDGQAQALHQLAQPPGGQRAQAVAVQLGGTSPRLWNLMWEALGTGDGSFYFDNFANLMDQFLVNKNRAKQTAAIQAVADTVEIVRFPGMVGSGTYPSPIPFSGMGSCQDGSSCDSSSGGRSGNA